LGVMGLLSKEVNRLAGRVVRCGHGQRPGCYSGSTFSHARKHKKYTFSVNLAW
jgi:hypothetical protein